ncbi:MAG: glycosyltransferase family 1 protein [Chloroflexi bacterium]|nr:glycosyltransferase family 1 protein [Chloroflexota bacterium]
MRLCLVTGEYPPQQGGVGDYTYQLAYHLNQLGVEVIVLTGAGPKGKDPWPVHRVVPKWDWRIWTYLDRLNNRFNPDIVHIQYQTAAYGLHPAINLWPLCRRLPGSRHQSTIVVTYHDAKHPYLFPKAGRLRPWVTYCLANWSDAVIATNPYDWHVLEQELSGRPVHLVPIGSNIPTAPPVGYDRAAWRRDVCRVDDNQFLMVYFGFLNASKGADDLVTALGLLQHAHFPVQLLMLGGTVGASDPTNAAYLAKVKASITAQNLDSYVRWTDFLPPDQVSAYLLAADAAVLPYQDGATFRRGSLMAVLKHGLPVVTTSSIEDTGKIPGGHFPSLNHRQNAYLVPVKDPQAIAGAVEDLIMHPDLRQMLSQGAADLSQAFTWESIAHKTRYIYQTLV